MATAVAAGTRKLSAAPHNQTPFSMPDRVPVAPVPGVLPHDIHIVGRLFFAGVTFRPALADCTKASNAGGVLNSAYAVNVCEWKTGACTSAMAGIGVRPAR